MDAASDQALARSTQITSYTAAGLFTVVIYDFILKFPPELELIWFKPWSVVTILYVLVRYLGMIVVLLRLVNGVITGHDKICYTLLVSYTFINLFLIVAAQAIMIIRVFALYRNSKAMLWFLISCCLAEMAVLIGCAIKVYALRGGTGQVVITGNDLCAYTSPGRENYTPEFLMVGAIGCFQAIILITAVYSFVNHFWKNRHNRPELQSSGIVSFITGNVLYFALLFVGIGLSAATYAVSNGTAVPADVGIFDMTAYTFPLFGFCIIGPYLVLSVRVAHFRAQRRARKAGFNQSFGMNAIQVQVEQESKTTVEL